MKKFSLLMLLSLIVAMTSCDKQSAIGEPIGDSVTFNLSTEYEVEVVKSGETRSSGLTRYVVEIYEGTDLTKDPIHEEEYSGSTFTVPLDGSQTYTCLFWADMGTVDNNVDGTYNADSLMNVTLNTGKQMTLAFFARYNMKAYSDDAHNVTLKRSMARINLIATDIVAANATLIAAHNAYSQFNVYSGEVSGVASLFTTNFKLNPIGDTLVSFYTFASVSGSSSDFSFTLGGTVANNVVDVPLKANYSTNIKGRFSFQDHGFHLNISEDWDGEYNVPLVSSTGFYKTATYEGPGVRIDGLWWAPVNVGYTAANPYGLLFNWGVNEGFEYGTTGHSATGGNWVDEDQGPCPDGWRVPKRSEYQNLLAVANSPLGTDSSPGQWHDARAENPNGLAGRWFGPECKTATVTNLGNSVFLPAAGYWLHTTGEFTNRGSTGFYWSSVSIGDFNFANAFARMAGSDVNCGFPVRCVQN